MNKLKSGSGIIFVGGAPRSGTTLLQNMLDSHPKILGGPEFLHLRDIMELRRKFHYSIEKKWIDQYCSIESIDHLFTYFIETLLTGFAEKHNYTIFSEKTPENVLVFSELMNLFPGAMFIQIIRDPRAIVSSMLQVGQRFRKANEKPPHFTKNVYSAIKYTRYCLKSGYTASKMNSNRILSVKYEDLVTDPEYETKKICYFLKIEWDKKMICPGEVKHLGESAITSTVWYDKETFARNPETNEVVKWKKQLSLPARALILASFKNYEPLTCFQYRLSDDPIPSAFAVLFAFFIKLRFMLKASLSKVSKLYKGFFSI